MTGYYHKKITYLRPPDDKFLARKIRWPASDIIAMVDSDDYQLMRAWSKWDQEINPFRQAQLLSARLAEKVALLYYTREKFSSKDISISQIQPFPGEWQNHDLLLEGKIAIDVKNARTSVHNQTRFLNHCVPAFKHDRAGQDVIIASVISPYLNLEQIRGENEIKMNTSDFIFLGETTLSKIDCLEKEFLTDQFKIEIRSSRGDVTMIPAWVFDYYLSHRWLKTEKFEHSISQTQSGVEIVADFTSKGNISKPIFNKCLSGNQEKFINTIKQHMHLGMSLPVLYLSIWEDFLKNISIPGMDYNPSDLYSVLYKDKSAQHPLRLEDPLGIIYELIHSLVLLAQQNTVDWRSIRKFELKGEGFLIGQTIQGEKITLMAYCGGTAPGKGKCCHGPLIIGKNRSCPICGRLICDCCNFCSPNCVRSNNENEDEESINF
jgi:hypothetical protein